MGHHITGLIARRETLAKLDGPLGGQPHFLLEAGFGFCPLDIDNLDNVVGLQVGDVIGEFFYLSPKLIDLLRSASKSEPMAYVETEYHGSEGGQGAIVVRDGDVIFGPLFEARDVINTALRLLGVSSSSNGVDAFDTVGLDRYRSNDDFRHEATPP